MTIVFRLLFWVTESLNLDPSSIKESIPLHPTFDHSFNFHLNISKKKNERDIPHDRDRWTILYIFPRIHVTLAIDRRDNADGGPLYREVSRIDIEADAHDVAGVVDDRNRCRNNSISRRQSDYTGPCLPRRANR